MNLTVTEPESPGWMRATPTGQSAATTSNVNFFAGDTVPNLVICKLGDGGRITVDGYGTGAHVLGDVFGYFGATGSQLRTVRPEADARHPRRASAPPKAQVGPASDSIRLADRRPGAGSRATPSGRDAQRHRDQRRRPDVRHGVARRGGQPDTSNLNVFAGQTVANLVICRLGSTGARAARQPGRRL